MALPHHRITLISFVLIVTITITCGERITHFKQATLDKLNAVPQTAKLVELTDEISDGSSEPASSYTPILFWHGMGDTAYGSINLERINLQRLFPNIKVFSVQIGSNAMEDRLASYFSNANSQIDDVCKEILTNPAIRAHGSLNAVGFSQGSQFVRGLIQRCPFQQNGIRVKNFISLGGQHQGVFGLPNCQLRGFCEYINHLLSEGAYDHKIQSSLVQAAYWHDPIKEGIYRDKSIFIADLNNERHINQTYIENLQQLNSMVLVEFAQDRMVTPRESSLFGFYADGGTSKIIPLESSDLYVKDRLGLKKLKESSRLHMISVPGDHLQYKMSWFTEQIALVYLNN